MSRTDDVINVGGVRLSTGAIEEVIISHPDILESAVVGMNDSIMGEKPLGFVVMKVGMCHFLFFLKLRYDDFTVHIMNSESISAPHYVVKD